ncbi:DUF1501 domain-containing protein [Anatilimnocola sp. NA78]|uniref:DUF1501 domain-containing protein n=1 Tax=Anatilimnocola sp. NA78 TaxID=3415683 RepID=UPI003CE57E72
MLEVTYGSAGRYCDGISRRSALKLGFAGLGGLTLAGLYRAEAAAGIKSSNKAVINIHLGGGPSHQDMFDLKPEAAKEFRGEFNPIKTNVSGFDICEHFPRLAAMADKFAVIRSLIGMVDDHSNFHTQTGYGRKDLQNIGGRPGIGAVVSKLLGPSGSGAPAHIAYNDAPVGYLGPVYKGYRPSGGDLKLVGSMTADRLESRTNLLSSLDKLRRETDGSGQMKALDSFTQRAVGVVTSGDVANALDLDKEDKKVRERYGKDMDSFLRARRLVEAGVRVVTFDWGGWDTHANNFDSLRKQLPRLDQGMSALINDLHERGMDKDVTIVMWGEFGRTPRVNSGAGRDHWSRVAMGFLAGGGMRTGQFIGSSTKNAEEAKDRPVHLLEVFSTIYHNMGIDVSRTQLIDPAGRPQYLTDNRAPIKELI